MVGECPLYEQKRVMYTMSELEKIEGCEGHALKSWDYENKVMGVLGDKTWPE